MKRNYTYNKDNKTGSTFNFLKKGLKKVNIGDDVWVIGKLNYLNNRPHSIIYGPDRKEYHIWDNTAQDIHNSYCNRHGCSAVENKLKIYILTNILDDVCNWEFNLDKIPSKEKLKVILENGTVRNIDFNGVFNPQEIVSKRFTFNKETTYSYPHSTRVFKNIIGYRK